MKKILNFILFWINIFVQIQHAICCGYLPTVNCPCGFNISSGGPRRSAGRIVQGYRTVDEEMPWMAGIYQDHSLLGQGVLINDYYILSSMDIFVAVDHNRKIYYNVTDVIIVFGTIMRDYWNDSLHQYPRSKPTLRSAQKIISHPKYNFSKDDEYDIALVQLNTPFKRFERNIWPICLPPKLFTFLDKVVISAAWGFTGPYGLRSTMLRWFPLQVYPIVDCIHYYKDFNANITLCAASVIYPKALCNFDMGAPLMFKTQDGHYVMIGIAGVRAGGTCSEVKPFIFIKVNEFLDWIKENTKDAFYCIYRNPFQGPPARNCDCGINNFDRGRAGRDEEDTEFPWRAEIYAALWLYGYGTLINNRYILTSASVFVYYDPQTKKIVNLKDEEKAKGKPVALIGSEKAGTKTPHDLYHLIPTSRVIMYPDYNPHIPHLFDIALVRLKHVIWEYKVSLLPICVPIVQPVPFIQSTGNYIVTFQERNTQKNIKPVISARITDTEKCNKSYAIYNMCAEADQTQGECTIQKGSGWYFSQFANQITLVGISINVTCANNKMEIVATNVTDYMGWLAQETIDAKYCQNELPYK